MTSKLITPELIEKALEAAERYPGDFVTTFSARDGKRAVMRAALSAVVGDIVEACAQVAETELPAHDVPIMFHTEFARGGVRFARTNIAIRIRSLAPKEDSNG